jgi:hypothetical protein
MVANLHIDVDLTLPGSFSKQRMRLKQPGFRTWGLECDVPADSSGVAAEPILHDEIARASELGFPLVQLTNSWRLNTLCVANTH